MLRPRHLIAASLTVGICALGPAAAGAQAQGCIDSGGSCVMVIQVTGLEAKDVTPETTPFLWGLAHPGSNQAAQQITGQRNGFIWQAARGPMTAGTAPAAAALLTGGDPEQTAVPADEFIKEDGERVRFGPEVGVAGEPRGISGSGELDKQSIHELLDEEYEDDVDTAVFAGDPGFGPLAADEADTYWLPRPTDDDDVPGDQTADGDPAYCPAPRHPEAPSNAGHCIANDLQVLNQALTQLAEDRAAEVNFTYIQLAELGARKLRSTEVDAPLESQDPEQPGSVAYALADTDAALASFFQRYAQNALTGPKLAATTVMVVGDHGYEQALEARRVPNPNAGSTPDSNGEDLEDYVVTSDNRFDFVAQGSVGTVYCVASCGSATAPHAGLAELKAGIEGEVNDECEAMPGGGTCIDEVLYMRPELAPGSDETVQAQHPDWNLDHVGADENGNSTGPSGRSGDLLVVLRPGWATGQAAPTVKDMAGDGGQGVTNPYPATAGGPRNRAIAAIVNGPQTAPEDKRVRPFAGPSSSGRYPVFADEVSAKSTPEVPDCPTNPQPKFSDEPAPDPTPLETGVAAANANPEDDANSPGHFCQAEIHDFLPTAAALMEVSVPDEQLAGRILNEAFPELAPPPCEPGEPGCPIPPEPPDTFFISGPVCGDVDEGPIIDPNPDPDDICAGQDPETGVVQGVTENADAAPTFEFIADPADVPTSFECRLDEGAWAPCSSPHTVDPPLEMGSTHTFQTRGINESGSDDTPASATFRVVDPPPPPVIVQAPPPPKKPQCKKLICKLKAFSSGPKRLRIEAEFGSKFSLVGLAFYKQTTPGKPERCDSFVEAPEDELTPEGGTPAEETAPASTREKPGGGGGGGKRCDVKTLANFDPFMIKRGPAKLKLKIPKFFRGKRQPTHVGVFVRRAKKLDLPKRKQKQCKRDDDRPAILCDYRAYGEPGGGIVHIRKEKGKGGGKGGG